jgi:histone H3/H4
MLTRIARRMQSLIKDDQDLSLPKSMIARLSKGVLPPNTQIHKDALLALHKSATVFVSYIASKFVPHTALC